MEKLKVKNGDLGSELCSLTCQLPRNIAGPVGTPVQAAKPHFQVLPEGQECGGRPHLQKENIPECGLFSRTSLVKILWPTGSKVDFSHWNNWGGLVPWGETVPQIPFTHAIKGFKGDDHHLELGPEAKRQQMQLTQQLCHVSPEGPPELSTPSCALPVFSFGIFFKHALQ